MLTRDNEQILLNEIHVLCMEAADHYEAATSKEGGADMKPIFSAAAEEHRGFAAKLAAYIRLNDDQPKLPDPDRETLALFLTSIKGRLANNERQMLIEDQVKMEQRLSETITTALRCDLPQDVKLLLEDILAKANSMQHVLRNAE
ncbi:hypothetical protein Q8A64_03915 [Oxalobacteraceae bacterium R-40]|uniref:DUF2383 domain-containing protein n=1 Tax=Keguizhuia sedimenti TaxID=3064264 RepID=A0ABU1BKM3_9BURK|nr:hypothetical protein [Oxalobacteraceae bacterium R-40]